MVKRVVEIEVKTTGEKELKSLDSQVRGVGGAAKIAVKSVAALGAATLATAVALATMIKNSADSRRELNSLARQAGLTTDQFESLSFATQQYGVSAEQIADISKDVSDRVGEFATAGTGAFQDFVDVTRLSRSEALALADSWQELSGDQIIGEVTRRLEEAGATGAQTTFVLESLGNDLSKLAPLFANNSKELTRLTSEYDKLNGTLNITETQAAALSESAKNFDLLSASFDKASTAISATLAPVFNDFFNDVIKVVPDATQSIIDFINSFLDAENITSLSAINKEIKETQRLIDGANERIENQIGRNRQAAVLQRQREQERLKNLIAQRDVLEQQTKSISDANRLGGGEIGGFSPVTDTAFSTGEQFAAEQEKFDGLASIRDGFFQDEFLAYQERAQGLSELEQAIGQENLRLFETNIAERQEMEKAAAQQTLSTGVQFLNGLAQLNKKSDGLKRASIIANTAEAVIKTYNNAGGYPFGIIPAGIMAAIGAQQLAQVGKKSGNISGGSGGGSSPSSAGLGGSPTVAQQTARVNTVENTALTELKNELASRDPNELLPVDFVRKVVVSMKELSGTGQA